MNLCGSRNVPCHTSGPPCSTLRVCMQTLQSVNATVTTLLRVFEGFNFYVFSKLFLVLLVMYTKWTRVSSSYLRVVCNLSQNIFLSVFIISDTSSVNEKVYKGLLYEAQRGLDLTPKLVTAGTWVSKDGWSLRLIGLQIWKENQDSLFGS